MDVVCDGRLDGSRDEASSWVWGSVHGKGVILEVNVGHPILTNWEFDVVCCQITLCSLV